MNASRRLCFALALALAACTSVGCSDDDDDDDRRPPADTGGVIDTGTPVDTGAPADTETPTDTAVADTAGPTTHTVTVGAGGANTFSPANLTIKVGDKVVWTAGSIGHTVTEAADGTSCTVMPSGFDSGDLANGASFERTFNTAGTINYICKPHCSVGMRGTITVE